MVLPRVAFPSLFDKIGKRPVGFLALIFLLSGLGARSPLVGQMAPTEAWRTFETPHFRVTYPERLRELRDRAAAAAERAYGHLADLLEETPKGKIDLILSDHTDLSNGIARYRPSNRIVLFAPPPVDRLSLAYFDDWVEILVSHELLHIFHFDMTGPIGSLARRTMGRVAPRWPVFPNASMPTWVVEGLAVHHESEATGFGRTVGTFHEMVVRTAILEDAFDRIDQVSGSSPVWPGGERAYIYGSLFFDYLFTRYGAEKGKDFMKAVARQWIPYRLDSAAGKVFGISFSQAWKDWREELEGRYRALSDSLRSLRPLTVGRALTEAGYFAFHPSVSPDWKSVGLRAVGRGEPSPAPAPADRWRLG